MTRAGTALTLAAISIVISGCAGAEDDSTGGSDTNVETNTFVAQGILNFADGSNAGTVSLSERDGSLVLGIEGQGLPEGPHGFHLHQKGICEMPDFKSAGGHLNPLGNSHGTESPGGSHLGDLPNLQVIGASLESQEFTITGSAEDVSRWVFDEDGTAVVIHADADDYKSDPSGNAGARIACAVLTPG